MIGSIRKGNSSSAGLVFTICLAYIRSLGLLGNIDMLCRRLSQLRVELPWDKLLIGGWLDRLQEETNVNRRPLVLQLLYALVGQYALLAL